MAGYTPVKTDHAPLDESVKMPAAIRAAAARSDALHKQTYEEPAHEAPKPKDDAPEVEAPKADAPATEQAPAASESGTEDEFKRKYHSVKGRYDQLVTTVSGLNSTIQQLQNEVAQLRAQPQQQQPTADLQFRDITAEERETYGEDFLDVASRAAAPQIKALKAQVDELNSRLGNVQQVTQQSATERMRSFLTEQLPNWQTLNRDPNFLAWVNLPDPFSGAIRVNMMRDAYNANDGQRVLNFFNGYLAQEAATDPAKTGQPEIPKPGKVPLEDFAAPGRARAPAASTLPGDKETISQAQIANFYRLVQKGHYRGNEAEKERLEQMIFAAQADGRVTT